MNPDRFLAQTWGQQGDGYFCLSTKSRSGKWRDTFFKSPVSRKDVQSFVERHHEDNIYFCPTSFSAPRRLKKNVLGSRFLWADLDDADPTKIKIRPQIAWKSSPGRYAALWRLHDFVEPAPLEEVNRQLTYVSGADKAGWDLTQVLRLPGTINYKYKERPTVELMWATDNEIGLDDVPSSVPPDTGKLLNRLKPSLRKLLTTRVDIGKRSDVLWRIENELHDHGVSKADALALIKASPCNKFSGRRDEDSQLNRELDKIGEWGHKKSPLIEEEMNGVDHPTIRRMSEVEPEVVRWIWYPYIPRGKITLLEGDPGLGKSWLTTAIAATISTRTKLPLADKFVGGRVLLFSAEDGLGDTIRPRLDGLGADVSRIYAYDDPVIFDEDGCDLIRTQIHEMKPALVVIDPLVAYMGRGVDLHKANETREIMSRLGRLAADENVGILAVRHLTKGGRDKSIYRGIGSIDLTAAARSVLLVGRIPDDKSGRAMVQIKNNLAPVGEAIRYELRPGFKHPFRWGGKIKITADEVLKAEPTLDGEADMACVYLKALDENFDRSTVIRDAEAKGINAKVLRATAKELGIKL
jgi:DNA repair protein RadA/Sms